MDKTRTYSKSTQSLRLFQTATSFFVAVSTGMQGATLGPSLVLLEQIFNTNTYVMGLALSFHYGGYLFGSMVAAVVFDKINSELQFIVYCLVAGTSFITATYSYHIYLFITLLTLNGLSRGLLETGNNVYMLTLWHGASLKNSILQATHLFWALGCLSAPLIVYNMFIEDNTSLMAVDKNEFNETMENVNTTQGVNNDGVHSVYTVIGATSGINVIMNGITFVILGPTLSKLEKFPDREPGNGNTSKRAKSRWFNIIFFTLLVLFYLAFVIILSSPVNFLSVFIINGFGWSVEFGALLIFVMWVSMAVGRLTTVPITYCVRIDAIIVTCIIFVTIGYVLLLFTSSLGKAGLITSLIIIGFFSGPIYSAQMGWVSMHMNFTGFVSCICNLGAGFGRMFSSYILGYTIENVGHMWMVYIPLMACGQLAIVFALLNVLVRHRIGTVKGVEVEETDNELIS